MVIICTYGFAPEEEVANYQPAIVLLDERNAIKETLTI